MLAAVSLAVMPSLSYAERRTGHELGSATAVADSKQALLRWSWVAPMAALVIAAIAAKEGGDAWRGDTCCAISPSVAQPEGDEGCGCGRGCCLPVTSVYGIRGPAVAGYCRG